jgi:glycosyltransferase involved in cell wall biosynthesis
MKTESEVVANWRDDDVQVSVLCICFNHEKFLDKCLEGILTQQTNFAFQIIIFDDLSTDGSREIIDRWVKRYPKIIRKKLYPDENQYQKKNRAVNFLLGEIDTPYAAFCECDDYWCATRKLQEQFNALEKRKDVDLSFHPAYTLRDDHLRDDNYGYHGAASIVVKVEDIIEVSGGFMPMASIFIRVKKLLDLREKHPYFFKKLVRHSAIQILGSVTGGALYINKYMSVYRSMHPGSWTFSNTHNQNVKYDSYIEFLMRNNALDEMTGNRYTRLFKRAGRRRLFHFISGSGLSYTNRATFLFRLWRVKQLSCSLKFQASFFALYGTGKYSLKRLLAGLKVNANARE